MKSGSRRVEARTYPLSSEIARTSLPATGPRLLFRHFSPRLDDFCRNANATLPPSPQRFYPPIFEKNHFKRTFGFGHRVYSRLSLISFCEIARTSPLSYSRIVLSRFLHLLDFYIYFKSLYYRRRDEVWLDLDNIPGRQRWRGKEGREKRRTLVNLGRNRQCQGRNVLVTPRFRHLLSLAKIVPAILKRGTPILPLIPLPQFHARPKKFPPTSIQKDENTLSVSLSTPLFSPL